MARKMKYINFENIGLVIFETNVNHDSMRQLVGHNAISAGFCSFPNKDENGNEARCYGRSTTLRLDSAPEDTQRLQQILNPYGW